MDGGTERLFGFLELGLIKWCLRVHACVCVVYYVGLLSFERIFYFGLGIGSFVLFLGVCCIFRFGGLAMETAARDGEIGGLGSS